MPVVLISLEMVIASPICGRSSQNVELTAEERVFFCQIRLQLPAPPVLVAVSSKLSPEQIVDLETDTVRFGSGNIRIILLLL